MPYLNEEELREQIKEQEKKIKYYQTMVKLETKYLNELKAKLDYLTK